MATHRAAIGLMICSFVAALVVAKQVLIDGQTYNGVLYHWVLDGNYAFNVGFLIDQTFRSDDGHCHFCVALSCIFIPLAICMMIPVTNGFSAMFRYLHL